MQRRGGREGGGDFATILWENRGPGSLKILINFGVGGGGGRGGGTGQNEKNM